MYLYRDIGTLDVYRTLAWFIELAKEWAATDITDDYANHYVFDMPDAKLHNLSDDQYTILN